MPKSQVLVPSILRDVIKDWDLYPRISKDIEEWLCFSKNTEEFLNISGRKRDKNTILYDNTIKVDSGSINIITSFFRRANYPSPGFVHISLQKDLPKARSDRNLSTSDGLPQIGPLLVAAGGSKPRSQPILYVFLRQGL